MNMLKFYFISCTLISCLSLAQTLAPVTVNSRVGSITGFQESILVDGENKLVSKFLGIPYAESSAGANRFMKPIPKAPFKTKFDARNIPDACYQQSIQEADLYRNVYKGPGYSEDCLSLNIYVPNDLHSRDLLPVMIWIHGGGFTQGTASVYNPEVLAVYGNVILVTINYRLGMFGFMRDKNGAFPGNQGLWDQHLAIKWVHDNIDMFSGYKDEITIFGESAGGASVLLQALYPGNMGLFKRVISESGTAVAPWAVIEASNFEDYFSEIGCSQDSNMFSKCLTAKDPTALYSNITRFGPVLDNDFLVAMPVDILTGDASETARARDFFTSLDIIVGVNSLDGAVSRTVFPGIIGHSLDVNITGDEYVNKILPFMQEDAFAHVKDNSTKSVLDKLLQFAYTPWQQPNDYVAVRNQIQDLTNDVDFFAPALRTVHIHSGLRQGNTFLYEFAVDVRESAIPKEPWMKGANHFDEVPYVFGIPLGNKTDVFGQSFSFMSDDRQLSRGMMAFWSNFAKSGNPNFPMDVTGFVNTTWSSYTRTSTRFIRVVSPMALTTVSDSFYPRRMAYWSYIWEVMASASGQ